MNSFKKFIQETTYHKNFSYNEFKRLNGTKVYAIDANGMIEDYRFLKERNPNDTFWIAMSLGSSFHDPQLQIKIVNTKDAPVPEGIAPIKNAGELSKIWKAMKEIETKAWKYSRRNYNKI